MRRVGMVLALALLTPACLGASAAERAVRVDFSHDEFASYYWRFFPRSIEAHPGDTVVFDQEWTGEPHTVTLGTIVDRALAEFDRLEPEFDRVEAAGSDVDPDVLARLEAAYEEAVADIPGSQSFGEIQQNWAQPCYLDEGAPPKDPDASCTAAQQRQRPFDGRQTFYSSGYIAPEGQWGNRFSVALSEDIEPGTYRLMCTIHLPFMTGELVVKPPAERVPSQAEVNERAREEIEELAGPLRRAYTAATAGRATTSGETRIPLPMGGYHAEDEFTVGIAEFIPRTVQARAGEPVTWTLVGAHTVSFDVPRFVPIYFVDRDGTVRRNPVVDGAAGGSPDPPPVDFLKGPVEIDGGTWDGSGFYSSGLIGSEPVSRYTLRVSEPGTYRFACLVHPRMVGSLVVTE